MTAARDGFRWVHLTALALAVVMVPWSTAFLSMAQMLLAANWLGEGIVRKDLVGRFRRAFTSAPVLVFLSFLGLHALGLLWTTDLAWGLDLNRILLPVLVCGVVLGEAPPLDARELRTILLLGAWSAVVCVVTGDLLSSPDADYRSLAHFISHIRLALLLAFAIVVFVHYGPALARPWRLLALVSIVFAWRYIGELGSLQAMALLLVIAAVMLWRTAARWRSGPRWSARALVVLLPVAAIAWTAITVAGRGGRQPVPVDRGERTAGGELYMHDPANPQTENGHLVWTYVAWGELARSWDLRSAVPFDSLDARGRAISGTLVRYLASKGLRKDSVAVMGLTEAEVRSVEDGITSVRGDRWRGLRARIDEVLWELDRYRVYGEANGHSVTMRLEYWKAGWAIAKDHWPAGVGTGDTRPAFAAQYERMQSRLLPEWRHRAHNEYLTLLISFGVFGLAWALFSWWWPAWRMGAWRDPLFIAWAALFLGACLTDDTIETQAGATFFALYYALLVFAAPGRTVTASRPAG